ncbi:MAG: Gfo/Idh/MocA family oxidoreductase [Rhodospirillales bacterium]|nr:Gfo/Idh/MocA family oxidoreductase [Rhodospirillales bacterium]
MNDAILIVGFGSIGKRHARIVSEMLSEASVIVLRRPGSTGEVEGVKVVQHLDEALATKPRFAILAGPSPFRLDVATQLVEAGIPLLLEKPLSNRLQGTDDFFALCKEHQVIVQVGYCLRFAPSLMAFKAALAEKRCGDVHQIKAEVGQYLPDWRPDVDYRKSVSARKDMGGGALLELSHEIDYVRWLFGDVATVTGKLENISDLEMDVEDFASLDITFENGMAGLINLDMVQRQATRKCEVIGSEGTLIWDGIEKTVKLYSSETDQWDTLYEENQKTSSDMYMNQFQHFLNCLETGDAPLVGVEDGIKVLEIVEAVRQSHKEGQSVTL